MNSNMILILFCAILIVLPAMSSYARRKRYESTMKRYLDKREKK